MSYCPRCRHSITEEAHFCSNCGQSLGPTFEERPAGKGFTKLFLLGGCATVVVAAGIAGALLAAGVVSLGDDTEPVRVLPQQQVPTASGPRLTSAEAAGKANVHMLTMMRESGRSDLSVTCNDGEYSQRSKEWTVRCAVLGPQNALDVWLTVDDRTGFVSLLQ